MAVNFLDFEQPIAELEAKIEELKHVPSGSAVNIQEEIARLQAKSEQLTQSIFANLIPGRSPSSRVIRSAPTRSTTPGSSSRTSTSCMAIACTATISPSSAVRRVSTTPVMLIGHQKGRDTKERVRRNYGMPKPEGYRKALRLMRLAERFRLPLITFIDTPGAYPGVGAEERNQSEAIARNLFEMSVMGIPIISVRDRRGRFGWRARDRRLRPDADAPVLDLLRDLARGLRFDPLEERGQERSGGGCDELTAHRLFNSSWSTRCSPSRWAARIAMRRPSPHHQAALLKYLGELAEAAARQATRSRAMPASTASAYSAKSPN